MALGLISKIRGMRETVGIDVGHYSIKYVKVLHGASGNKIVVDADLERVPDGSIVNGEIQVREGDAPTNENGQREKDGAELLSDALNKLLLRHPIDDSCDVVASVNCGAGAGGVLVDKISVKVPKNGNEAAIILQTAQSRPPFDDQDNVIDYEISSRENDELKVNVVAAKSALLDSWAQFFNRRGVKLAALDVDIFGMLNAYVATMEDKDRDQTVALFNVGEKKMSVAFVQDGVFHSMRAMAGGSLDMVVSKTCMNLGIDSEKCHEILSKGDLSVVDGFSEAEVEAALRLAYEDLMAQIDIGIRYFSSSEDSKPLNKILLGGGGAAAPGLKDFIEERSGIETDTVNPFRLVPCDSKVFGEGGISIALSNIYAPALGLAMRKF
ncbi:pilus assembly protein PilM [Fibrobacter sp. UWH4]|uniref:pilus assembly protein PilM n=1 Tax=Fibrobacter sp. UWH4 TaxID=1896210 RepID=UPI0009161071|nr:pilus assembly protein PilM [Fibrobacter sp. UWH4]SHK52512.1 type IV pilus assembly protein PilM [Fibrobacter sp. UWH4]